MGCHIKQIVIAVKLGAQDTVAMLRAVHAPFMLSFWGADSPVWRRPVRLVPWRAGTGTSASRCWTRTRTPP